MLSVIELGPAETRRKTILLIVPVGFPLTSGYAYASASLSLFEPDSHDSRIRRIFGYIFVLLTVGRNNTVTTEEVRLSVRMFGVFPGVGCSLSAAYIVGNTPIRVKEIRIAGIEMLVGLYCLRDVRYNIRPKNTSENPMRTPGLVINII